MADIIKTKAPNLPIPTISYSQTYQESFSNAERIYFNTLDAANGQTIVAIDGILADIAALQAAVAAQQIQINNLNVNNWLNLTTGIF